jgi:hypothetical protein
LTFHPKIKRTLIYCFNNPILYQIYQSYEKNDILKKQEENPEENNFDWVLK